MQTMLNLIYNGITGKVYCDKYHNKHICHVNKSKSD